MSMLAEKKRREKWSLNPRGKAWSEDQNKFGQRLMEKMGWKSGEGLGANSQGQTDIVKTRVKNDSKGLGFKENGEEWLKTTCEFDNLLEELASSQDDSGEGSQTEAPVSLEDRSKKSRARVHYHKFTRGKDLSRYTEKDLASIIGPDVIKLKNEQESKSEFKSDYTQNQVNKGSIEDYFNNKKSKLKDNLVDPNVVNGGISGDFKENFNYPSGEMKTLNYTSQSVKEDSETVGEFYGKKHKKSKRSVEKSTTVQENSSDSKTEDGLLTLDIEVSSKRKRKSNNDSENNLQGLEENFTHLASTSHIKKKKRKIKEEVTENSGNDIEENFQETVENSAQLGSTNQVKKKKRKNKEVTEDLEDNNLYLNDNSLADTSAVNEGIVPEKKKKKIRNENKEESYAENNFENSKEAVIDDNSVKVEKKKQKCKIEKHQDNDLAVSEELGGCTDVIKKKTKDKKKEYQDDCMESQDGHKEKCIDRNPILAEETFVTDDLITKKKKKKKSKDRDTDLQEKSSEEKESLEENHEKSKGESIGTSEATQLSEQASPQNKPGEFLEVLGRKTRLRAIKSKTIINEPYTTGDFMSFDKTNDSNKEVDKQENSESQLTEKAKEEYVYGKSNPLDLSVNKSVLRYEFIQVKNRLRHINKFETIKKPSIIITDAQNLTKRETIQLKEIHLMRYYKKFLSPEDQLDITTAVKEFCKGKNINMKPGNKMDLRAIKRKRVINEPYTTGDFMSFDKTNGSKKEVDKQENSESQLTEKTKEEYVYGKSNPLDLSVNKSVLRYEFIQVKNRLRRRKKFETIKKPFIVITDAQNLSKRDTIQLKEIHLMRYYKQFLSAEDQLDIETAVKEFCKEKNINTEPGNKMDLSSDNTNIPEGNEAKTSSESAKSNEVKTCAKDEKTNLMKCFVEATLDESEMPKHLVAYEYRLVSARLKHLKITVPEVKVVIKETNTLTESVRRKMKQISKIKFMKTLLPPSELAEVEDLVAKFYDDLKPKIKIMNLMEELEQKIAEVAKDLDENSNEKNASESKNLSPENAVAMSDLFQKLVSLVDVCRKTNEESNASDTNKENADTSNKGESRFQWLKKVEEKVDVLKNHIEMLKKGEKPPDLKNTSDTHKIKGNKKEHLQVNSSSGNKHRYGSKSYAKGKFVHNVGNQRGRGRGIGRGQFVQKRAVPSGGWGVLKSYGSGTEGSSDHRSHRHVSGFGNPRTLMGRGRSFGSKVVYRNCHKDKSLRGARGSVGRGRGAFDGTRRLAVRKLGRISQNNYDARKYAEKCKELNKVPELCFNGVNMKGISGYPSNVGFIEVDKSSSLKTEDSKALGNQTTVPKIEPKKEDNGGS